MHAFLPLNNVLAFARFLIDSFEECLVVKIEAESLDLWGDWKLVEDSDASGGKYITWEGEGMQAGSNNRDANNGNIISTMIMIPEAGTYSFKVSYNRSRWVGGMENHSEIMKRWIWMRPPALADDPWISSTLSHISCRMLPFFLFFPLISLTPQAILAAEHAFLSGSCVSLTTLRAIAATIPGCTSPTPIVSGPRAPAGATEASSRSSAGR